MASDIWTDPATSVHLVPLAHCGAMDRAEVGGKAQTLGKLLSAGLPVPEGVCLTTAAFEAACRTAGITETLESGIRSVCDEPIQRARTMTWMRRAVIECDLPENVLAPLYAISEGLLQLGPVAVRSSAPDEDLPEAGAGIYHSELGLTSVDGILAAVRRCWASLFTERASFHRRGRLGDAMAVILQRQVLPSIAGVLMTADPMRRDAGMLVEAAFADSDSVTSGRHASVRARIGGGNMPPTDIATVLTESLIAFGERVQRLFGRDADIEWAWEAGKLVLLQARAQSGIARCTAEPGWVAQEDVEQVYELPLGDCGRLFARQLQKKVWFRAFCRDAAIPTFRVVYVVYNREALRDLGPSLLEQLRMPCLHIDWGTTECFSPRDRLIEVLATGADHNRGVGGYSCAQVGEIVPATSTGYAARLASGDVLVEAFPNGLRGLKSGIYSATRYVIDSDVRVVTCTTAAFDRVAQLDESTGRWHERKARPYALTLNQQHLRQIRGAIDKLADRFGEVRLEWYGSGETVYVKDLSLESYELSPLRSVDVISIGAASGAAFRIADPSAFDALARDRNLSVVAQTLETEDALDHDAFAAVLRFAANEPSVIVIADYPSTGLIPLVPFVDGFVFLRGTLLCHTGIVLREHRIPAIVAPEAASLETGNRIAITPEGIISFG